ncbi:F0F1 ATP synthase subunit A [Tetragenococcus koreensis]|uniref:ATP synthase subunit a n=1 Tax=Tetragenococcus koreensis TaxID=290335 RepID=A0AAN4UCJ1_9ENTE|nr:F0F1 ATP synthase subunit A [Tetragenococcus koreensis]AYW45402.1 F0F1 ATP synthase subunit A [Tetragenococcus koreensis]MCF1583996.1 F0F1 ATP synthase subunit A [Tetragenococcus koreensis]MCF1613457.1 F0F1 ATP synthase subunit A [Tetragenococcus koreensis]MCF1618081.1 F0F1 ATP synthase subunit A [Tetragenococcus koreensis]MCF1618804.1 F0F1 ATP synthase subunit A [Tetragenococcus koreensis]
MDERSLLFHIGPVWFDGTIVIMTLLTCAIIFAVVVICTRNLQMKPKGKQNFIEWVIDFVRGVASSQLPKKEVGNYDFYAFVLFLFIFVSNEIGLITKIVIHDDLTLWKSPTADPVVTLGLAFMVILLTHFFGVKKMGTKEYLVNSYLRPVGIVLPIKLLEEFTNVITLGLRLYGNIFAGEILLGLIVSIVNNLGWLALPLAIPLEMIWIGFSLFIGAIQAYVFVTLAMVFLDNKIEKE